MKKYSLLFISILSFLILGNAQNSEVCPPQEEEDPNLFAASMGGSLKITGQYVSIAVVGEPVSSGNLFSPIYRDSGFGLLSRGNLRPNAVIIADANIDNQLVYKVEAESDVQLRGIKSCDPDFEPINFSWSGSSNLSIQPSTAMNPSFTAPPIRGIKEYEVYLTVDDGQLISQPDTAKFLVADPGWVVVTYSGQHFFRARVQLNGLPADIGDALGAFVGNECRGYAIVEDYFGGEALVTMAIQTETPEQVEFKVYDESDNTVCDVSGTYGIAPNGDTPPTTLNGICGALPSDFISLKATPVNQAIDVAWETALEWNVDKYILERSEDGKVFSSIFEVEAKNEATALYNFRDMKVKPQTTYYYRVKTVDLDGSEATSIIVSAALDKKSADKIGLFPNPTTGQVFLTTTGVYKGIITVEIYNNTGRLVRTFLVDDLTNRYSIDLSDLPASIYTIHLTSNDLNQINQISLIK